MPDIDNEAASAKAKILKARRAELEQLARTAAERIKTLKGPRFSTGYRYPVKGLGSDIVVWTVSKSAISGEILGLTESGQLVRADLIRTALLSSREWWSDYYLVDLSNLSADERSKRRILQEAIAEG